METLAKICMWGVPIGLVIFLFLMFISFRKGKKTCPRCHKELVSIKYGLKCPSCMILFEDPDNDKLNIS